MFELTLKTVGGKKTTISETDADFVFDMVVHASQTMTGQKLTLRWLDFFTALKLVAVKQNRGLADLIRDLTFAGLGDDLRRGWADLCPRGVESRMGAIFAQFTNGGGEITKDLFVRLLSDCEVLDPPRFTANNAELAFAMVAQTWFTSGPRGSIPGGATNLSATVAGYGTGTSGDRGVYNWKEQKLPYAAFGMLLQRVARERRLPVEEIRGMVAWSFGPRLRPDPTYVGDQRLV